jgi:hypothetical protein
MINTHLHRHSGSFSFVLGPLVTILFANDISEVVAIVSIALSLAGCIPFFENHSNPFGDLAFFPIPYTLDVDNLVPFSDSFFELGWCGFAGIVKSVSNS